MERAGISAGGVEGYAGRERAGVGVWWCEGVLWAAFQSCASGACCPCAALHPSCVWQVARGGLRRAGCGLLSRLAMLASPLSGAEGNLLTFGRKRGVGCGDGRPPLQRGEQRGERGAPCHLGVASWSLPPTGVPCGPWDGAGSVWLVLGTLEQRRSDSFSQRRVPGSLGGEELVAGGPGGISDSFFPSVCMLAEFSGPQHCCLF